MDEEPSDEQCEEAIQGFVEVTKTDTACAHFFLQDVNWNLKRALENFFRHIDVAPVAAESAAQANAGVLVAEEEKSSLNGMTRTVRIETGPTSTSGGQQASQFTPFIFASWNIDGLDNANLETRFRAVCCTISKVSADIVFLQEMVPKLVTRIRGYLQGEYSILLASPNNMYFTAVLLKPRVQLISHHCIPFERTSMGRSMQIVEAKIGDMEINLLNTHLESTKQHSDIRIEQLTECFDLISKWNDENIFSIFGGDLNIRDSEIKSIPSGFTDAWIAGGSLENMRYTWDCRLNDNKSAGNARLRFDRIYFNKAHMIKSIEFALEGQNRIRSSLCFASDHWAIVVHFT